MRHRAFLLTLALAACSSSPASIQVEEPLLVFEPSPQTLTLAALDKNGEVLEDVTVKVGTSSDVDVLEVGKDGRVRCVKSGVSTLSLSAGEVTKDVELRCALVKEVRVLPNALERVLVPEQDGSFKAVAIEPLKVEVVDHDGSITNAVPLNANSSAEKVVTVGKDHSLSLVGPGAATVSFTAGNKSAKVEVVVGEEVLRETDLKVESRDERGFPLQPGRYLASVGADHPVSLAFAGTDCESERGTEVKLECTLEKTATVMVQNHPGLSFGDDAEVKLRVVKLP
ncbi:MAG: hypothetical protein H6740_14085 [Alphaproteobacteria bacterium]|nr:hypothetical protein [Alphaproteobacteria bacterium]